MSLGLWGAHHWFTIPCFLTQQGKKFRNKSASICLKNNWQYLYRFKISKTLPPLGIYPNKCNQCIKKTPDHMCSLQYFLNQPNIGSTTTCEWIKKMWHIYNRIWLLFNMNRLFIYGNLDSTEKPNIKSNKENAKKHSISHMLPVKCMN